MPREIDPAQSVSRLHVGQVWEHHSTGLYKIVSFGSFGRVEIRHLGDDEHRGVEVWPDYLRENFTLYEEHA